MQTQLCEFCLKSGMLCSKCQTKMKTGAVSKDYMEVAKKCWNELQGKVYSAEELSKVQKLLQEYRSR